MKLIQSILLFSLFVSLSTSAQAGLFPVKCKPAGCYDNVECAPCSYTCCPEVKTEKVKKHCWEVECEPVCIPEVQCPLFNFFRKNKCEPCSDVDVFGRPLNSLRAKVRVVKKLKKVEYECEKCVIEWNVQCLSAGSRKSRDTTGVESGCCQIR